jgi:hypothetical protein
MLLELESDVLCSIRKLGNTVVRNERAAHISSTEMLCSNRIHGGGRNGSAAHSTQTEVLCSISNRGALQH